MQNPSLHSMAKKQRLSMLKQVAHSNYCILKSEQSLPMA